MMNTLKNFEVLLEKKNLKMTRERRYIYDKVSRIKGHFDADELYDSLKNESHEIARGTVYRTIPLLLESGVIQKSVGKGKREFFETNSAKGHHDHIICVNCGKVVEYHCQEIEELQIKVCEKYKVKLLFHEHKLYVHCEKCAN